MSSKDLILAGLVLLLALAAFAGTLGYELVWDDRGVLEHIGSVTGRQGWKGIFTSQFATHLEEGHVSGFYRPVPMASLWLDTHYASVFPYQYHLVNFLLHGINTLLVFLVIRIAASRFSAFTGSGIFSVHPVHTESVAFVSGRTDLWAALFVLLAVYLWLRVRNGQADRIGTERWLSLSAFLLACLSKEVAYVLPAILLIWDAVFPAGSSEVQPGWWVRNRFWICGWIAVLSSVAFMRFVVFGPGLGVVRPGVFPSPTTGDALTVGVVFEAFLMYLRLIIVPWPLRVFYSNSELAVTLTTVIAVLGIVILFIAAITKGRKDVSIAAGTWIVMFLLPVLVLVLRDGAPLAERFLYLPSMGFCFLAGVLADAWSGGRRITLSVLGLVVLLMLYGTWIQNRVWKDEITLFTEFTRVSPETPGGYYNLGNALAAEDRHREAVPAFRRAIAIDHGYYKAYFNLGNSLLNLGRLKEAAESFQDVIDLDPSFVPGYINLGVTYMEAKEYDRSVETFLRGIQIAPEDPRLHVGLAMVYMESGDLTAAEEHQSELRKRNPELAAMTGRVLSEREPSPEDRTEKPIADHGP